MKLKPDWTIHWAITGLAERKKCRISTENFIEPAPAEGKVKSIVGAAQYTPY